jgi:hypothetical protein
MVFARITTAFVVGCLGLFGCAAPRGGENAAPDEGRGLTTDAGRLEVREEQYAGGAIRRRTEGRVDGNGKRKKKLLSSTVWSLPV